MIHAKYAGKRLAVIVKDIFMTRLKYGFVYRVSKKNPKVYFNIARRLYLCGVSAPIENFTRL